jgi:hypothetical protein
MIGNVIVGSNDLEKARNFFDVVLAELGGKRARGSHRLQCYSAGEGPMLAVCTPYDNQPATVGNGIMVSLVAPSRDLVDKVHAIALASGAMDEGAPRRHNDTFYGAYFRDLDGNKVCVFKMG